MSRTLVHSARLGCACVGSLAFASGVLAADLLVPDDFSSIQAAINAA